MPDAVDVKGQLGPWVFGKITKDEKEDKPKEEKKPSVYTDITIILDRSGSMSAIRNDTIAGIRNYMREVDEVPGEGCWSLVQFDDHDSARGAGEQFPQTVFAGVPNGSQSYDFAYQPRGGTALIDAVYSTIMAIKARIGERNHRVLVVIMTDGMENQSRLHSRSQLRQLIAERQAAGWQFLYLGANQDAFAEASNYGIDMKNPGYLRSFGAVNNTWQATSGGVSELCSAQNSASATAGTRNWKTEGLNEQLMVDPVTPPGSEAPGANP